jgi:hypothetical protein
MSTETAPALGNLSGFKKSPFKHKEGREGEKIQLFLKFLSDLKGRTYYYSLSDSARSKTSRFEACQTIDL